MFNVFSDFFEQNELDWKMFVECTTHGATGAMVQWLERPHRSR